jgi:hypothetical protein
MYIRMLVDQREQTFVIDAVKGNLHCKGEFQNFFFFEVECVRFYTRQNFLIYVLAWVSFTAAVTCIVSRGTKLFHHSEA